MKSGSATVSGNIARIRPPEIRLTSRYKTGIATVRYGRERKREREMIATTCARKKSGKKEEAKKTSKKRQRRPNVREIETRKVGRNKSEKC